MKLASQFLYLSASLFLLSFAGDLDAAAPQWTTIVTDNAEVEQLSQVLETAEAEQAIRSLQKLADGGNRDAVFALARAHALGRGVTASEEVAQRLLQQAADSEHPESVLAQAVIAEENGKDDALFLFSYAAELGQPLAQLRLGKCNEEGQLGLRPNLKLAVTFYERAHQAGIGRATYELARCYRDGVGVSPDAITSTRLMRRAADQGVVVAQRSMAEAYEQGLGLERDSVAAIGWLMLAAQNGDRDAMVQLGIRYERGQGVVQDFRKAGGFYDTAAKQGDPVALYRMAMLFANGRGTKQDRVRGYVLLQRVRNLPPAAKAISDLEVAMTEQELAAARKRLEAEKKPPK